MEIDFFEAEFIKQLCRELIIGVTAMQKQSDFGGSIGAISGFLGEDIPEDRINDVANILVEKKTACAHLINKINKAYGLKDFDADFD